MFNIDSKKKMITIISILVIILCCISIINQFSISSAESLKMNHNYLHIAQRHIAYFVISTIIVFFFFRLVHVSKIYLNAEYFYVFGATLILLLYTPLAKTVNGARRWIPIKFFTIQPSEFAKICLIIFIAYFFNEIAHRSKKQINRSIILLIFLVGFYAIGILFTKSFSATLQIAGIFFFMLCLNPTIPKKIPAILTALCFPLFILMIIIAPYRLARIFNKEHGLYSIKSISNGGIFGVGYGNGLSRNFYLPEVQTDYIFAGFSEEWGLIASIFLILIYVLLSIYIFQSVKFANSVFEKMCIIGVGVMFTNQYVLHLLINTALLPSTGITLPFMSYGGSSIFVSIFSIFLVIHIINNK